MCGLPGGYPDDLIDVDLDALEGPEADGVIRVTNADYLARPLRLTPTEATAIIVALRALRGSAARPRPARSSTGRWPSSRRRPRRAPPRCRSTRARRRAVPTWSGSRPTCSGAAARGRQVRLTYYVPSRDEESERVVDPRGVVTAHGFDYLDAWCHSAEAPRLFRLDRIQDAEVLDTADRDRAREPPRDLADGLFPRSPETTAGDAASSTPDGALDRRVLPGRRGPRPPRRARSRSTCVVADERWLQRLLLRLAPHARVLQPADVRRHRSPPPHRPRSASTSDGRRTMKTIQRPTR